MRRANWQVPLGLCLVALSALFYLVHYLLFRDAHHIFIYLVGDVAFVFVEVLLVTLIIHRVLEVRERKERLNKLNMVIGAFFSEVGADLLRTLSERDPEVQGIQRDLATEQTPSRELQRMRRHLAAREPHIEVDTLDWGYLKGFLTSKRNFLLRLLENPNLMEHESFTDVLWAVFHLTEELEARGTFHELPEADRPSGWRRTEGLRRAGPPVARLYGAPGAQLPVSVLAWHKDQSL